MKKVLFLLFSALIVCSGCDIHKTEIIKPGVDIYTEYITVSSGQWKRNEISDGAAGCYIYTTVPCKKIDRNVLDNGAVVVYMYDNEEGDNLLPYVFPVEIERGVTSQNIRFQLNKKGEITFVVEWGNAKIYTIDYDIKFKICIFAPEK
jgi:hypothetical protein